MKVTTYKIAGLLFDRHARELIIEVGIVEHHVLEPRAVNHIDVTSHLNLYLVPSVLKVIFILIIVFIREEFFL